MVQQTRKGEWLEIFVPEKWNAITAQYLFQNIWEAPKKLTHQFRMENKVLLNGKRINWNEPLVRGEKLRLKLFEEEDIQVIPTYHEIEVLYEDNHVMVLNKPPFMATHPNDPAVDKQTLVNAAAFHMLVCGENRNIRQIHRLDKDTSGAILFAKHPLAGAILDKRLEKREIKRTYIAVVQGLMKTMAGVIKAPIGRDRHHPTRRRVSASGQDAITHYKVLKHDKRNQLTYVKCWLDTGRTHQIRVHFSHIGYPLIGDGLYGGKPIVVRQALHSAKLEFLHPFTQEPLKCYAPFLDKPPIFHGININEI